MNNLPYYIRKARFGLRMGDSVVQDGLVTRAQRSVFRVYIWELLQKMWRKNLGLREKSRINGRCEARCLRQKPGKKARSLRK